ncbi:membrane protein insertase YidC [Aneurinibacillus terranovensis]|uniref:membrane protein insertase YidC n=1 Tax=Aneurinibacillus terranovensis TaxID=278991 RepID=UPI0006888387|nr:membrane protein insertase YidC [Aneurinibacillus terranovensis]
MAGCSAANPNHPLPIDPHGGIWDRFFVFPLSWLLQRSAEFFGGSYGIAILIVTVLVRLVILPLTIKQTKNQKRMQEIQPEIVKIREKYKNDPQKAQQEIMKVYQMHNANPITGCLPVFIQMPVLLAFYHSIIRTAQIRSHDFLWLQLGAKDPYYILPILAGLTTFLQQLIMMRYSPTMSENPQMKMMTYIMPVMIFVIAISLPSALSLYWVYGNIFTTIQNYFLYRDKGNAPKGGLAK